MKSLPLILLASVALLLTACNRSSQLPAASLDHPTASEVQDFKDGQAFAQGKFADTENKRTQVDFMRRFDSAFDDAGEFLNHSAYWNVGASYQEYRNISEWSTKYQQSPPDGVQDYDLRTAASSEKDAHARLEKYYGSSGMTAEQLAKVTDESAADAQALVQDSK